MAEAPESGVSEFTGRTVDEATRNALAQLGLRRDQVEIEVLSEGRQGILGVGAQPARISVASRPAPAPVPFPVPRETPKPAETIAPVAAAPLDDSFVNEGVGVPRAGLALDLDMTTDSAVDVLETLLQLMGFDATVTPREPVTPGDGEGMMAAVLDVAGAGDEDIGLLIGRRGETLAALQHLLNLIVNHQTHSDARYMVDVEGYRRRRENALRDLALRIADRVRENGQSMTLEPMPPAERRIVHIALADDPDVQTISIGEGEARKVAITPKR
jgi:spoIIIJ-associated protein